MDEVTEISDMPAAVEPEAVEPMPAAVEPEVKVSTRRSKADKAAEESEPEAVIEDDNRPVLYMHALTYVPRRKNSESVALLQRRLSDVGYADARADLRGWFHDNTRLALEKWQKDHNLEVTGECAYDDMRYLFDGAEVKIVQ